MPCDHQSRTWLDPVPPELLTPVFAHGFNPLGQPPQLTALRSWQKRLVVGLEGTQSFTSPHLSCPQCARQPPRNGTPASSPRMLTPVLVVPPQNKVIPRPPEFSVPQDGHAKPEWENAAAQRWLRQYAAT